MRYIKLSGIMARWVHGGGPRKIARRSSTWLVVPLSVFIPRSLRSSLPVLFILGDNFLILSRARLDENPRQAFLIVITPECEHRPTIRHTERARSLRKPRPAPSSSSPEETKFLTCEMNMLGYKTKPKKRFCGEEFHSQDMNNYRSAVEGGLKSGEGGAERRD